MPDKEQIAQGFQRVQQEICDGLEALDGSATFQSDLWERPGGGGGDTRILRHGQVIQKGGVNFSRVYGALSDQVRDMLKTEAREFFASGVSIVLHPVNPWVPIVHMNIRYFELPDTGKWWFGGGIDLTPHYVIPGEARAFHETLKAVCDEAHPGYYQRFKDWADDYFFIPHRDETRGVGGIFFDHLNSGSEPLSREKLHHFVMEVGRAFLPAYLPVAEVNKDRPYGERELRWQRLRRGRYVEFNLVYDRGTTFGLKTNGRTESILMSLPLEAGWEYNHQPELGSREEESQAWLKKGLDWLNVQ